MALDSDLLRRLREALKDPDARSLIRDEVNQSGSTNLDTTWGKLGAVGKAMEKGTGSQAAPWASGLGAGIGLLLRPLKQRRHGTSGTANRSLDDTPPASSYTPPPQVNASSAGSADGATFVQAAEPWKHGYTGGATASVADQQKLSTGVPEASAPPVPASQPNLSPPSLTTGSLVMGHGQFGNNVFSNDGGKTWTDENTQAPYAGQIFDKDTIGPGFRRGGKVAKGFVKAEPVPPPAPKRGVLTRRPMAIPILHTTIVIARKPEKEKPVKKQDGGKVEARPPKRGPGNGNKVFSSPAYRHNPPAPFAKGGRVQVPRGSGVAQRGKHFKGIF